MRINWSPRHFSVDDVRGWSLAGRLELQPDFQRKQVWSKAAKIMLIDSIINNFPMPKFFLQVVMRQDESHHIVIDGQQRLTAILEFLHNEYALDAPYEGAYAGMRFDELPEAVRHEVLRYTLDANEISDADKQTIRDIYSRVNKYTVQLNKQELRRADYPGQFLNLSESLANNKFFDDNRVFTIANSRRMGDVEYISELLAMLLDGPQDKKIRLDEFYQRYAKWSLEERKVVQGRFEAVVSDLNLIWQEGADLCGLRPFARTRFRQKADLYALFNAIDDFHKMGYDLTGKDVSALRQDFALLDKWIAPESPISLLQKYAIQCVSQSNTVGSREWRHDVLMGFMLGTYMGRLPGPAIIREFHNIKIEKFLKDGEMSRCPICGEYHECADTMTTDEVVIAWAPDATTYHLSNAHLVHLKCVCQAEGKKFATCTSYKTGVLDDSAFSECWVQE